MVQNFFMDLKDIAGNFILVNDIKSIDPYGNGHINSTYKVSLVNSENQYILQKINTQVFKYPEQIIKNHFKLQQFLETDTRDLKIPHLIHTKQDRFLFIDNESNAWRLMNFFKDSYSIEVVENENQASEAGRGFGWFLNQFAKIDSSVFFEAIKDFHSLSFRINQFNDAIEKNRAGRLIEIKDIVDFYKGEATELIEIEKLIKSGEIPERVVHNDTKINNLLFKDEKAVAVIDLDTAGKGTVLYDFGDAIRTISNTAAEDEKDLNKVDFNIKMFQAFTRGYLNQTKNLLTGKELDLLYIAPKYMTFIMGIRFLTDYLNGDVYYKIAYEKHNLKRSLVQKKLIEQMQKSKDKMRIIITENL